MAVVRFPRLSELQEAMADILAEECSSIPVVKAIQDIHFRWESCAIDEVMSRQMWTDYVIRKMGRLVPNQNYIFHKPAKMNAELLDLTKLRR